MYVNYPMVYVNVGNRGAAAPGPSGSNPYLK
jgi:hypothetical protein